MEKFKQAMKRTLATLMVAIMLICSAPLDGFVGLDIENPFSIEVEAVSKFSEATQENVGIVIDKYYSAVKGVDKGNYQYKRSGKTLAGQCHGFVNDMWYKTFKTDVYQGNSIETAKQTTFTADAIKAFLTQNARIGDIIRTEGGWTHSYLIRKITTTGIKFYEYGGSKNYSAGAHERTLTWAQIAKEFTNAFSTGKKAKHYFLYQAKDQKYTSVNATNQDIIFSYLKNTIGLNDAAACGFLANIKAESSFNPNSTYKESGGYTSYGICQWNQGRYTSLSKMAKNMGGNWNDLSVQLAYLKQELNSSYYKSRVLDPIKKVSNTIDGAKSAAETICRKFEVPANPDVQVVQRKKNAESFWKIYGGQTQVVSPKISSPSSIVGGVEITISCSTSGATIYYTTNGSTPTTASTKYAGAIKLYSTKTVKAIAVKSGMQSSSVVTSKITVGSISTPTIETSDTESGVRVSINCATSGTEIRYTTDGSAPNANSTKYAGIFSVTENATIRAIALKKGCSNSSIAEKVVVATAPKSAPNAFNKDGKTNYAKNETVNVSWSAVSGASNYLVEISNGNGVVIDASEINTTNEGISIDLIDEKFSSLVPGDYTLKVFAENYYGRGPASNTVKFSVKEDVTVKFVSFGKEVNSVTIPYGASLNLPGNPSTKGYIFKYWTLNGNKIETDDISAVYENKTFNAEWDIVEYTVSVKYPQIGHVGEQTRTQKVKFNQRVVLPEDVRVDSDYNLVGWTVSNVDDTSSLRDYEHVDSNMTITPVFQLKDSTKVLSIADDSFSVSFDGENTYTFKYDIKNLTSKAVANAEVIATITNEDGMIVGVVHQSLKTIAANSTLSNREIVINYNGNASKANLHIVNFSNNITGCSLSTQKTVNVEGKVSYGNWIETTTKPDETVAGRQIEVKKQTRKKETTTSTSSSLSGWIYNGSTPTYGSWSSWSSWNTTNQTETDVKDVETRTVYKYDHYCKDSYNLYPTSKSGTTYHVRYETTKWNNDRKSSDDKSLWMCDNHSGVCNKGQKSWYYRGTVTQYRYRTRTKTINYNYHRWTSWLDSTEWTNINEFGTIPSNTDTMQIVYRYRDKTDNGNATLKENQAQSNETMTAKGTISSDYSFEGKKAIAVVYKKTNDDMIANQIEAIVDNVQIDKNNSFDFSFIPKEKLNKNTGNFIVSIAVDGCDQRFNALVIEPEKEYYTVTYNYLDSSEQEVSRDVQVLEGMETPDIEVPGVSGKTFIGWDKKVYNVSSDLIINAEYQSEKYTVTYVDWETKDIETKIVNYGTILAVPDDKEDLTGKEFVGWSKFYVDGANDNTSIVVTENIVVEAIYETIKYTVTFVDVEGNELYSQQVGYGSAADLNLGKYESNVDLLANVDIGDGYTFLGWSNETCWWYVTQDVVVKPMYIYSEQSGIVQSETEEGKYIDGVVVTLNPSSENDIILYTTNGENPTFSYTEGDATDGSENIVPGLNTFVIEPEDLEECSLWFDSSVSIKTMAVQNGSEASEVSTYTFSIESDDNNFEVNVPSITLSTRESYGYEVGETYAVLPLIINNPLSEQIGEYGIFVIDETADSPLRFAESKLDTQSLVGVGFKITDLNPGTTYQFFAFVLIGDEMYETDQYEFTTQGEVIVHNHSYTSKITKAATCITVGVKTYTCSCGDSYTENISTTGHKETTLNAVSATYTKSGLTAGKKCSVCGTVTVAQKVVAKLALGKVSGLKVKTVKVAKSSEITLTWNKVNGAEKYEVYQYVSKKWKKIKTTTGTSYTVKKLKADKSYKFKVRAVVDDIKGKYSSTLIVETVPNTISKLTLKAGKKQLTASLKSVSNISGYEVQYSTSKKFTKKTTKTVNVKKSAKKTTIKKLKKGKKYYVRVRTYKTVNGEKIYSSWSAVKNVKVK